MQTVGVFFSDKQAWVFFCPVAIVPEQFPNIWMGERPPFPSSVACRRNSLISAWGYFLVPVCLYVCLIRDFILSNTEINTRDCGDFFFKSDPTAFCTAQSSPVDQFYPLCCARRVAEGRSMWRVTERISASERSGNTKTHPNESFERSQKTSPELCLVEEYS